MWRLECDRGRQVWKYDESKEALKRSEERKEQEAIMNAFDAQTNSNSGDKVYRAQAIRKNFKPLKLPKSLRKPDDELASSAYDSALKGINFYQALQDDDGHWPGDYGGPMFLMPGLVVACYVTGAMDEVLSRQHREQMIRYLSNHQSSEGGWGLHIESPSTMFGTAMNYVTLRLLGMSKDDPVAVRARKWIQDNGGAVYTPSWGKFYLCVLGIMEWECCNSLFPELWLLPSALPIHPSRFWCHCRMVYLPMAYLYGVRFVAESTPVLESLRKELYTCAYDEVNWSSFRDEVTSRDRYVETSPVVKLVNVFTNIYERCPIKFLRSRALDFILEYVEAEDEQTNHIDIGPVNKVINMMCVFHGRGSKSPGFRKHVARVRDYLWLAEDGMKMQGYNGSQLWDTGFAVQAITETCGRNANSKLLHNYFRECLKKAYNYVDISQVREDTPKRERYFRHISKGAWPFSTRDHGWPISDCTAEGVKCTLALNHTGLVVPVEQKTDGSIVQTIDKSRLCDAVNMMLSYQNSNGGWATYENTRGSPYLELLNPSEVFGDIIIDYSYVECSSACIQAMVKFAKDYPDHRTAEIRQSIERGVAFIKSIQRPHGGWYGSWGVCFCYGTWFGIEGLLAAGESPTSPEISRACKWLLSIQREDGGWGESYESSVKKEYVEHSQSLVVNTSWALLALMAASCSDQTAIERGIKFLVGRQQSTGDWNQEAISGVFNGNCMITYTAYRNVFPIWALGRYANQFLPSV